MAGFEIIPNVVTPPAARAFLDALEPAALHRSRAGARHLLGRRAGADFAGRMSAAC